MLDLDALLQTAGTLGSSFGTLVGIFLYNQPTCLAQEHLETLERHLNTLGITVFLVVMFLTGSLLYAYIASSGTSIGFAIGVMLAGLCRDFVRGIDRYMRARIISPRDIDLPPKEP